MTEGALRAERDRKCKCGGSIGAQHAKVAQGQFGKLYGCEWHSKRGATVCPARARQPVGLVEKRLIEHIATNVLNEKAVADIMTTVRAKLSQKFSAVQQDPAVWNKS